MQPVQQLLGYCGKKVPARSSDVFGAVSVTRAGMLGGTDAPRHRQRRVR